MKKKVRKKAKPPRLWKYNFVCECGAKVGTDSQRKLKREILKHEKCGTDHNETGYPPKERKE